MARNDLGFIVWNSNEEKTMNLNLVKLPRMVSMSMILTLSRALV